MIVTVVAILVLLAFASLAYRFTNSWVDPAASVPLIVAGFGAVAAVSFPRNPYLEVAMVYVMVVALIFVGGHLAATGHTPISSPTVKRELGVTERRSLLVAYTLLVGVGILGAALSTQVIATTFGWAQGVSREVAFARNTLGFRQSFIVQMLLSSLYSAAAVAGYVVGRGVQLRRAERAYLWLFILPPVLLGLLAASKGLIVGVFVFWFLFYAIGRHVGFRPLTTADVRRRIPVLALGFVSLAVVFLGIQGLRYGGIGQPLPDFITGLARTYVGAELPAFGTWLSGETPPESGYVASYTFSGISQSLGMGQRDLGLYTVFTSVDEASSTNVYTGWRSLIEDVGLAGSLFVVALAGVYSGLAWRSLALRGVWALFPMVITVGVYGWWLDSLFTSLWTYNSTIVAAAVPVAVIYRVSRRAEMTTEMSTQVIP